MKNSFITIATICSMIFFMSHTAWASVQFTPLTVKIDTLENYEDDKISFGVTTGESIYTALSPTGASSKVYGYLNTSGEVVIPPQYLFAGAFNKGHALVTKKIIENYGGGQRISNAERLIDIHGQENIPLSKISDNSNYYIKDYDNELVLWVAPGEQPLYGITDFQGKWLLPISFEELHLPKNNLCLAKKNGKYGYISIEDKQAKIDFIYEDALDFSQGLAAVKTNGLWGYIDLNGIWHIMPQYVQAQNFSENIAAVQTSTGWGAINITNELIIPAIFEEIKPCHENRIAVKMHGKYGYFNAAGEKVIDFKYREAGDYSAYLAVVSDDTDFPILQKKYQLINYWGEQLLPQEYAQIIIFDSEHGIVQKADDLTIALFTLKNITSNAPKHPTFIRLYLNDRYLASDTNPVIKSQRVYIPIRQLSEAIDTDIDWDAKNQIVTLHYNGHTMELTIGRNEAIINGQTKITDTAPFISQNRTMVPVRLVTEFFGFNVMWNQEKQAIYLTIME